MNRGCVCVVIVKWGVVVGRSLVSCWLFVGRCKRKQNFLIVLIDRWQRQFESVTVGVRPWQWVSSWKRPLCLGAAGLISDLDETAAIVDAIDGRYSSL